MGVEWFVSRRGTSVIIWSDNGTNFVGAEKELRENIEKWNTINIAVELAHKGIKWSFNPPSAPHQGGIWERLVRSFKRILYTILGTRRLTDEVLSTTFCLVEHALNSRPLTPVSTNPSDLGALTLNHFLGYQARRALTVHISNFFMWTDSTTVLQWLNSKSKRPIFVANCVCEILEHTSVDEWNHIASSDNPVDAGTRGMSAEVLQSSRCVKGPDFLRTKEFPFEPSTEVVKNIKLGIVPKETDENNTSLAASVTKSTKEPPPQLIPFDKYNYYQKLLRITAYRLRLLPSHECYRNIDGSIMDPTELDKAERHLQYLVHGESFNAERKDLLENKPVKRSSRIDPFSPFIGPNRLIRSAGRIKRLVEVDFDVKHPIILDARHAFVKLFLRHTHVIHHHQGIDYLRAKIQERYTILKLRFSLRSIKYNCVTRRMFRAATIQFIMADLPVERLAYQSPPFTNTRVDYFGPFYVTVRRTTEKR